MNEIKLGDKVRCKHTGFIGTAVVRSEFINGCTQIEVLPRCAKGNKILESVSIDIESLEVISKPKKKPVKKSTGGAMTKGLKVRGY